LRYCIDNTKRKLNQIVVYGPVGASCAGKPSPITTVFR
jgi:hypothetical protein